MSLYLIKNATVYDIQKKLWSSQDVGICGNSFVNVNANNKNWEIIDGSNKLLLPGIIDLHNDEIEIFFAPKRDVFFSGFDIMDKLMIGYYANGITSSHIAITYSLEPGIRNESKAYLILQQIKAYKKFFRFASSIKVNLRLELSADWTNILKIIDEFRSDIALVTLCDHSPNNMQKWSVQKFYRYIAGRSKIKAADFYLLLLNMKKNKEKNIRNVRSLYRELKERGLVIGLHDICYPIEYDPHIDFGEFPTNIKIIDYLHKEKKYVVLGTPNIRNGGSINNNISCLEACKLGKCDILCSDYDRNSVLTSISKLNPTLDGNFYECYKRISENPAHLLNVKKGIISPGYDADCILINSELTSPRIYKTFVNGEVAYESCF